MPRRPRSIVPQALRPADVPSVVLTGERPASDVVTARRRGSLVPVIRGVHVAAGSVPSEHYAAERFMTLAAAAGIHRRLRTPHVFSHTTGALLHGFPAVGGRTVHVTQWTRRPGQASRAYRRHYRTAPDQHSVEVAGLPVTDVVQTVIDCLATMDPLDALVVADAALRTGVTKGLVLARLAETPSHPCRRRVRDVLRYADDGAESPGETRARVVLLRVGLPVPQTQVEIRTAAGSFWSDLGWPELRLLAEYDGRAKYGRSGTDISAVLEEKRRQDLIEESHQRVLRIVAGDLPHPTSLLHRARQLAPALSGIPLIARPELAAR